MAERKKPAKKTPRKPAKKLAKKAAKKPAKKATPIRKKPAQTPSTTEYSRSELLRRLEQGVGNLPDLAYAICGSTAMAAQGYRRETDDVDLFVLAEALNTLMCRLQEQDLEVFAIAEPSHFAAKLPGDPDPDRRIDVLVPYSEPELTAVEYPVYIGALRYVRPVMLAMAKFYAYEDSNDMRQAADVQAMYRRGMFDASVVRDMIQAVDPERLEAWDRMVAAFTAHGRRRGAKRPSGRLPRPGREG